MINSTTGQRKKMLVTLNMMRLQLHPFFSCVQLQKAETSEADEVDEEPAVVQSAQVFAPKSLVLVSRLDYTEVFRVRHTSQLKQRLKHNT